MKIKLTTLIVVIVLAVAGTVGVMLLITNKDFGLMRTDKNDNGIIINEQANASVVEEKISNDIEEKNKTVSDSTIKKLYSYIEVKGYETESMISYPAYNSKVGKRELLKDEDIIYIAYSKIEDSEFEKVYDEQIFEVVLGENHDLSEFYYEDTSGKYLLKVSKEKVLEKAREIFGSDISINNYDQNISVIADYKNGYYYRFHDIPASGGDLYHWCWFSDYFCSTTGEEGSADFETQGYTKYDKYEADDKIINIYTYYINCYEMDSWDNPQFAVTTSNYDESTKVSITKEEYEQLENDKWSEELKEKAGYYKHTFKKDENGNYYWYSTEPVETK